MVSSAETIGAFKTGSDTVNLHRPTLATHSWNGELSSTPAIRALHSSTFQLNVSTFCPMWWGALLVSETKTAQVQQRCGRV